MRSRWTSTILVSATSQWLRRSRSDCDGCRPMSGSGTSNWPVFGEDVRIPLDVLAALWGRSSGWTAFGSAQFCRRLFRLGLLADYHRDLDESVLHDLVRA